MSRPKGQPDQPDPDRRTALKAIGALALLAGCGSEASAGGGGAGSGGGGAAGAAGGGAGGAGGAGTGGAGAGGAPGTCTLYPEQTEGPFYLDGKLMRRDVTEGRPGSPLTLRLTVLGADGCTPIEGAIVEIWQCDAGGVYSGHPGQLGGRNTTGETFLRGAQPTGAGGVAELRTIYPGWYPGRTTHIHFKVHLGDRTAVTSQLYFPDDVSARIYRQGVYAARGQKDTPNLEDGIFTSRAPALLAVSSDGAGGELGVLTITVARM